jgi:hypothetical protein
VIFASALKRLASGALRRTMQNAHAATKYETRLHRVLEVSSYWVRQDSSVRPGMVSQVGLAHEERV